MRDYLRGIFVWSVIAIGFNPVAADEPQPASLPQIESSRDDGYRGIWFTLGQRSEFGDKYSGGLGTYTANHVPLAIYVAEVDNNFFVYGGATVGQRHMLALAC